MKEHPLQNEIRNALAGQCFTFRANVGTGWQGVGAPIRTSRPITVHLMPGDVVLRQARPFSTGLPEGFSDLFGFVPVEITPDMVGKRVAIFHALEVKPEKKKPTAQQVAFIQAVNDNGGRSGVVRSVQDAVNVIHQGETCGIQSGDMKDSTK